MSARHADRYPNIVIAHAQAVAAAKFQAIWAVAAAAGDRALSTNEAVRPIIQIVALRQR